MTLRVIPREKPADYVYTETEVKRFSELDRRIKALEDAPTPEPYTLPVATADTLGGVKIGAGLTVDEDGTIGVEAEGEYELIETIMLEEGTVIERTVEPNGIPYNFEAITLRIKKPEGVVVSSVMGITAETRKRTLHSLYFVPTTKTDERWAFAKVEKYRGKWLRGRAPDWDVYNSTMYSYDVIYPMFDSSAKDDAITRVYSTKLIPAGLVIEIWAVKT